MFGFPVIERFGVVAPAGMLAPTPHIVTPVSMLGHMLAPMRHVVVPASMLAPTHPRSMEMRPRSRKF